MPDPIATCLSAGREGPGEWLPVQEPGVLPPLLGTLSSLAASVGTDPALPDDPTRPQNIYHMPQSSRVWGLMSRFDLQVERPEPRLRLPHPSSLAVYPVICHILPN